jgi:hypothetical protein
MAKEFVIVKGKLVRMNEAAFEIALKRFGATKNRPTEKAIPIELLRMPKLQIQPRIQPEVKVVEAQKLEPVIEKVAESVPVEKAPEPVKKEPAKVIRRKR